MNDRRRGRRGRTLALIAGLVLAVAATATLVLTDQVPLLRLAVIGALWAFLIAAFLGGQRRAAEESAAPGGAEVALRHTQELELELEREVARRREFELGLEVQLRREIEGALREEVAGLRGDIGRLRQDILGRWDGELRVSGSPSGPNPPGSAGSGRRCRPCTTRPGGCNSTVARRPSRSRSGS